MPSPVQTIDVRDFMTRHLAEVFSTMLSFDTSLSEETTQIPHFPARVTGAVGFGGERVNGVVYLHLSAEFARRAAAAMLGITPEELGSEAEENDVIGEITNMLTGGLKSALCDSGATCAVSTPSIIRGTSFEIEPPPDVDRVVVPFDCGADRAAVEIHIQFN